MMVSQIKTTIKNDVDDQSIDDAALMQWIIDADNAIQTWKPKDERIQTFDWWDYLKDEKAYITKANINKYHLPDNFRAFVELKIGSDTTPYKIIDYRARESFNDHVVYVLGKNFYVKGTPAIAGDPMSFVFVRFTEELSNDMDEPEIESIYHGAYVEYGKKKYYAQQGDTELENKAEANFEVWMMRKWRDQELMRMQSASDQVGIEVSSIV